MDKMYRLLNDPRVRAIANEDCGTSGSTSEGLGHSSTTSGRPPFTPTVRSSGPRKKFPEGKKRKSSDVEFTKEVFWLADRDRETCFKPAEKSTARNKKRSKIMSFKKSMTEGEIKQKIADEMLISSPKNVLILHPEGGILSPLPLGDNVSLNGSLIWDKFQRRDIYVSDLEFRSFLEILGESSPPDCNKSGSSQNVTPSASQNVTPSASQTVTPSASQSVTPSANQTVTPSEKVIPEPVTAAAVLSDFNELTIKGADHRIEVERQDPLKAAFSFVDLGVDLLCNLRVQFKDEVAVDVGGPKRGFISLTSPRCQNQ